MITLFILSTLEGWPDTLNEVVDGGKDIRGPVYDNNITYVPFLFVIFIAVGSFLCVNLFIAIVNMNFN
jgi:hypothetical protein